MGCGGCCPITPTTETTVSATTGATVLLAANPNRKNAIIQNIDSTVLQVSMSSKAFGGGGVLVQQYDTWNAHQCDAGVYQGAIYGIRSGTSGTVYVTEEE